MAYCAYVLHTMNHNGIHGWYIEELGLKEPSKDMAKVFGFDFEFSFENMF